MLFFMDWQQLISSKRWGKAGTQRSTSERRTEFQRDYDRLIFSSAFRRMQNKTQVFPLPGSVFVHNRLTHSLEVSSVGRSLGTDVADVLKKRYPDYPDELWSEFGAVVSAACLAHDMGNPPFGHSGERAIRSFFSEGRGAEMKDTLDFTPGEWQDITRFDGNANTFRLLTHHFNGRRRGGFVMTYSTLASIVKYPFSSSLAKKAKFGFFESERDTFERIARELGIPCLEDKGREGVRYARHPLVYLVEAADDICYEIMDIEDAHKLRILSNEATTRLFLDFFAPEEQERLMTAYEDCTDTDDRIVYLRSCVINALERACVRIFTDHEAEILGGTFQGSLIDHLPEPLKSAYSRCTKIAAEQIYNCKGVTDIDLAGYHIIYTLLGLMTEAVLSPQKAYSELLMRQVSPQYELTAERPAERIFAVLDYLSGMTDVYALDLYRKINGHSLPGV